jgi:hypothetical protein
MSRRFVTLLDRATRIRQLIEREQQLPAPSPTRLMRMKQLYLHASASLRKMTEKRLVAMASAPRFRPQLVFRNTKSAPAFSGRW